MQEAIKVMSIVLSVNTREYLSNLAKNSHSYNDSDEKMTRRECHSKEDTLSCHLIIKIVEMKHKIPYHKSLSHEQ